MNNYLIYHMYNEQYNSNFFKGNLHFNEKITLNHRK